MTRALLRILVRLLLLAQLVLRIAGCGDAGQPLDDCLGEAVRQLLTLLENVDSLPIQ